MPPLYQQGGAVLVLGISKNGQSGHAFISAECFFRPPFFPQAMVLMERHGYSAIPIVSERCDSTVVEMLTVTDIQVSR